MTRSASADGAGRGRPRIAVAHAAPQFRRSPRLCIGALVAAVLMGAAAPARAQAFISPMYGVNFGGVSGCPKLAGCRDEQTNASIAAGLFRKVIGFEAEVAYAPTFLGEAVGLSSSALTIMGSAMLAPEVGRLRPYMLGGLGLIRARVELTAARPTTTNDNVLGFVVGGGVMGFVTPHIGLRVDMRYVHSFSNFTVAGLTLSSDNIDYSRAGVGVVVRF